MASISDEIDLFIAQSLLGGESLFNLESIIISNGNLLWNDKKQLEIIILKGNALWNDKIRHKIIISIRFAVWNDIPPQFGTVLNWRP